MKYSDISRITESFDEPEADERMYTSMANSRVNVNVPHLQELRHLHKQILHEITATYSGSVHKPKPVMVSHDTHVQKTYYNSDGSSHTPSVITKSASLTWSYDKRLWPELSDRPLIIPHMTLDTIQSKFMAMVQTVAQSSYYRNQWRAIHDFCEEFDQYARDEGYSSIGDANVMDSVNFGLLVANVAEKDAHEKCPYLLDLRRRLVAVDCAIVQLSWRYCNQLKPKD